MNDKRVDAATGERMRFSSKILPPRCRKSPKVSEVPPLLYLHGCRPGTSCPQEIYNAEDRAHAEKAVESFAKTYGAMFPKAVAKITEDREELLAFYDFPAEHWIHLRITNPIESTFSTVKLRTKVTRGTGSRTAALAMVFKLIDPPRLAGARPTAPTSSPWSAPVPSSKTASSSSESKPRRPESPCRLSLRDREKRTSPCPNTLPR